MVAVIAVVVVVQVVIAATSQVKTAAAVQVLNLHLEYLLPPVTQLQLALVVLAFLRMPTKAIMVPTVFLQLFHQQAVVVVEVPTIGLV